MKQRDYQKAILEKLDENNQVTCEECGSKSPLAHALVDHATGSVKVVCHSCYLKKHGDA
jgi:transcription elongation factor Elf1